jgi:hypothetical protein
MMLGFKPGLDALGRLSAFHENRDKCDQHHTRLILLGAMRNVVRRVVSAINEAKQIGKAHTQKNFRYTIGFATMPIYFCE